MTKKKTAKKESKKVAKKATTKKKPAKKAEAPVVQAEEVSSSTAPVRREATEEDHYKKFMMQLKYNKKNVLEGKMLVIDPGQYGGWAMYVEGVCKKSGSWKAKGRTFNMRLKSIQESISKLSEADVLVIELIHTPNKKTIVSSYMKLLKAVGVCIANTKWTYSMEIHPIVWQGELGEDFRKSTDEEDAKQMGQAVVQLAKKM